jgi:hypothetical protein
MNFPFVKLRSILSLVASANSTLKDSRPKVE